LLRLEDLTVTGAISPLLVKSGTRIPPSLLTMSRGIRVLALLPIPRVLLAL
jgi:hypothetical protein